MDVKTDVRLNKETKNYVHPSQKYMRYQNEVIGVGSFKRVYKCIDVFEGIEYAWNEVSLEKLEPTIAIKVFQEMEMMRRCQHQNIIKIYDQWFENDNLLIFITELIQGGSLYQYVHRIVPPIRLSIIQRWLQQILSAIAYLHSKNIVHRDIKAQNILIDCTTGDVKLCDFGLATLSHFLEEIDISSQSKQSMVGTTEFMAPEIYTQAYDERIDIFAFGQMVIELVTKEFPYQECKHALEVYQHVIDGIQPEVLKRITNPPLRDFIITSTNKSSKDRPHADALLKHEFFKQQYTDELGVASQQKSIPSVTQQAQQSQQSQQAQSQNQGFMPIPASGAILSPTNGEKNSIAQQQFYIRVIKQYFKQDAENIQINIGCQLDGKDKVINFYLFGGDTFNDTYPQLLINSQSEGFKHNLKIALTKLFDKWQKSGIQCDDVFYPYEKKE